MWLDVRYLEVIDVKNFFFYGKEVFLMIINLQVSNIKTMYCDFCFIGFIHLVLEKKKTKTVRCPKKTKKKKNDRLRQ